MTKAQRTAAELKDAARRLLVRKGYADMKITDITEEAGRANGLFYRYFTDKAALLRALIADLDPDPPEPPRTADVRVRVERYWRGYVARQAEMIGVFQAALVHKEFQAAHEQLRDREVRAWARHILDLRADGDPSGAYATALSIACLLEYFCYTQCTGQAPQLSDEAAIATLTGLITGGVLANR